MHIAWPARMKISMMSTKCQSSQVLKLSLDSRRSINLCRAFVVSKDCVFRLLAGFCGAEGMRTLPCTSAESRAGAKMHPQLKVREGYPFVLLEIPPHPLSVSETKHGGIKYAGRVQRAVDASAVAYFSEKRCNKRYEKRYCKG